MLIDLQGSFEGYINSKNQTGCYICKNAK